MTSRGLLGISVGLLAYSLDLWRWFWHAISFGKPVRESWRYARWAAGSDERG